MRHELILCNSEREYIKELNLRLLAGFRYIAGSAVVKSLENDIVFATGQILMDTLPQFSMAIRGEKDTVVFSKNIANFKKEVNTLLASGGCQPVIGSMSVHSVCQDGHIPCKRGMTTYYSCCVSKE